MEPDHLSIVVDKDEDGKITREQMQIALEEAEDGNRSLKVVSTTDTPKQVIIICRVMGRRLAGM